MSTTPTPGMRGKPPVGVFPALKSSDASRPVAQAIQQNYSLVYSLRDTVGQAQDTIAKLIQYDRHLNRTLTNPQSMPEGMLWFETDRNTVFYQTRLQPNSTTRDWYYAGGIFYETLANRPTDLDNVHDIGFLFLGSDTHQLSRWNGTGWDQVL